MALPQVTDRQPRPHPCCAPSSKAHPGFLQSPPPTVLTTAGRGGLDSSGHCSNGPGSGEGARCVWSEVVVHAQRLLQLLAYPLVEEDLLAQVVLHHVLEVELTALVEVVHLSL